MSMLSLSEAKDHLSSLVDEAERTHEIITITKHGRAAAALLAADDLDSLHETIYWLSQPGMRSDLADAAQAVAAGDTIDSGELRRRLGLSAS